MNFHLQRVNYTNKKNHSLKHKNNNNNNSNPNNWNRIKYFIAIKFIQEVFKLAVTPNL